MSQSLSRILVHLIFSTKDRQPVLRPLLYDLYPVIATTLKDAKCPAITIGGWDDHLHLLLVLHREEAIARAVKTVKICSTKWIKQHSQRHQTFAWQGGYGSFSVSQSEVTRVSRYIENQDKHHQKLSFKHEYIRFLDKHQIEYDPQYLWT